MPRPLSPSRWLLRWLDESATPLYALDGERRIVFASRSLGQWLGVEPDKLVGLRCDYHAAGDGPLAPLASALCPPPEAFAGTCQRGEVCRSEPGPFERRPARFLRLADANGDIGLLLVAVMPAADGEPGHASDSLAPQRLHALLVELRSKLGKRFHTSQLIGESDAMRRVREQVRIAAQARTRVLIVGPPGSGREHVARTIHHAQPAKSIGPLVPIACPLVDAEQMQATLASVLRRQYEKPAERPAAALLLDVDRLRPDAQQELAGFFLLPNIELNTLATSARNLHRLASKGKFRSDLALALSTITVALPPLKRRIEDVPLLAQHFLEEAGAARNVPLSGFHPAAMELLVSYGWPGNVDELARAVHEACQRATGPQVLAADLPDWMHLAHSAAAHPPNDDEAIRLDDFLAEVERELLQRALAKARGNKSRAAQLLGINRARLLRRLSQLGLAPELAAPEEAAAEEPVIFEPLDGP